MHGLRQSDWKSSMEESLLNLDLLKILFLFILTLVVNQILQKSFFLK